MIAGRRDVSKKNSSVALDTPRQQSETTPGEAVVVSCTNLATYDIIGRLEAELAAAPNHMH